MMEPDTYRSKNVYHMKPENVERRDGEVFTGNLMEMNSLRRSEQFKNVLFSDNMSSMDVRERLEEAFPELSNTRFSCAKRESRDSAKLNFDGDRRVWDGITIKRKLPGSSAMYIVVEDEGTDSGVSSAAEYLSQPSPLETLRNIFIEPDWGPVQGGTPVKLNNIQVDSSVQILQAFFGRRQANLVRTPDGNSWLGVTPGGDFEGQTVRVVVGNGTTKFTYMDRTEKAFQDILNNTEIWSDFFNKLDQHQNSRGLGNDVLGLSQEGRQLQSVEILRRLLFTAARIGEEKFIRLVFGTSAGRAAFEAYKNKSPLPENIADENGHGKIAAYLQSITERFSKDNPTRQTQSKAVIINWREILNAIEDSKVQCCSKGAKTKEEEGDNILETVYFGDAEESSDSDKERNEDEHIQPLHNELQPIRRQTTKKSKQKLNLSQSKDAAALTANTKFKKKICERKNRLVGLEAEDTDQADREQRLSVQLKTIKEKLYTYVASPLQVPEIEQDHLKTAVKLDLLTRLSEWLQELYTEALGMATEVCKCSEELRKHYYDLAYHGLRNDHQKLVKLVKDLKPAQEKMSEEEKKEYKRLQSYQKGRQSEVERLDKLWRSFFFSEDDLPTDSEQAAREHRVEDQLRNINEQLRLYVISPLQVQEVTQDQLRTAVKLDLLTRLSERLQELYTEAQGMVAEACKCSEDLRKDFYDLAYHGLKAEHFQLVSRVKDLEPALEEMSEEEKKEFDKLQSYQKGRQCQVERLNRLWRSLFSPSDHRLLKAGKRPMSLEFFRIESKEVKRYTDPDEMWKKLKLLGQETESVTPSTSNDDKPGKVSRFNLVEKKPAKRSVIQTILRKKDGGEKKGSNTPRTLLRDC